MSNFDMELLLSLRICRVAQTEGFLMNDTLIEFVQIGFLFLHYTIFTLILPTTLGPCQNYEADIFTLGT